MPTTITDHQGNKHVVEVHLYRDQLLLRAVSDCGWVGEIDCCVENGQLHIDNLIVYERDEVSQSRDCIKPGRGKGVGRALLRLGLDYAASLGVRAATGEISKGDHVATPHLLEWYRRAGFEILPATSDKDAATIRKNL